MVLYHALLLAGAILPTHRPSVAPTARAHHPLAAATPLFHETFDTTDAWNLLTPKWILSNHALASQDDKDTGLQADQPAMKHAAIAVLHEPIDPAGKGRSAVSLPRHCRSAALLPRGPKW